MRLSACEKSGSVLKLACCTEARSLFQNPSLMPLRGRSWPHDRRADGRGRDRPGEDAAIDQRGIVAQ